MKDRNCQTERRLQAGDAKCRALKFDDLFMRRMRRMICCDSVHGAIGQCDKKSFTIFGSTERRIHLEIRVVVAQVGIRECKVMRSDFTTYPRAVSLPAAN